MKTYILTALSLISILFTACNKERGKEISSEEYRRLYENKENDNKRFAISGYPFIDGDVTIGRNNNTIEVYTQPGGKGDRIAGFTMPFGKRSNCFYVPDNFTLTDLKLYDNDGNALSYKDKISFSYTLDLDTNRARMKSFYFQKTPGNPIPKTVDVMVYFHQEKNIRIDKTK